MNRSYYPSELAHLWQQALSQINDKQRSLLARRAKLYALVDDVATVAMPRGWFVVYRGTEHGDKLAAAIGEAAGHPVRLQLVPTPRRSWLSRNI